MNFLFPPGSKRDTIQSQLFALASGVLFLYSLALMLAPVVRNHTWTAALRWQHWIGFVVWLVCFVVLHRLSRLHLADRDPYILPAIGLLSGIGLLTIWRLDSMGVLISGFGFKQTLWLALGTILFALGIRHTKFIELLRRYKYVWLISGFILLGLTFLFGTYPSGSGPKLWLTLGFAYIQPSELLKLLLIIYLAAYLSERLPIGWSLVQILAPTILLIAVVTLVLFAQRDLGTASIFILLYFSIIFIATGKRRILLIGAGLIIAAAIASYFAFSPIQSRINTWFNPWADAANRSYQTVQSLIAVASGGVFGTGPGLGNPRVVPVSHSDFIFTSIAEELGLFGTFAILLVFALLITRGMIVTIKTQTNFLRFLTAGITVYLGVQSILIMAGNLNLLPLTGVTLPFVSYGGSSLITSFSAGCILLIASNRTDDHILTIEKPFSYQLITGGILAGFAVIALTLGYYGLIRADALQSRVDNPRWAINDLYVIRGTIFDRHNEVLAHTTGEVGNYSRNLAYPDLSSTIGYSLPRYGQGGLEASLDSYLRGIQGVPSSQIVWQNLLYNQPPPGLDVRTTISLDLQKTADEMMQDKKGALVLINAKSGEVLAISSRPTFNANQFDTMWQEWKDDPHAPLINRATQAQYPIGTMLSPFLYTGYLSTSQPLPTTPSSWEYRNGKGDLLTCTVRPKDDSWVSAVQAGCPNSAFLMGKQLELFGVRNVYKVWGFSESKTFPLQASEPSRIELLATAEEAAMGQGAFRVSPMQVVEAAAAFSSQGYRPTPLLALSVDTPREGWVVLPVQKNMATYPANVVNSVAERMTVPGEAYWQSVGSATSADGPITWVIAGTVPSWKGTPIAMVVVLEEDNPALAMQIVETVIKATLE